MRCSFEWLQQWVAIESDAATLGERLTMAGLELNALEAVSHALSGVVVGRVVDAQPHPNADKLKLCKVDRGAQQAHDVVCGAANARVGMLAAYAPPGARIGGQQIQAKNIRGVASNGMLCSAYELGLAAEREGLLELDDDAEVGSSLVEYLKLDDLVYDLDLTPNRADCLSILGVAREVAAMEGRDLHFPKWHTVSVAHQGAAQIKLLQPAACPRYLSKEIRRINTHSTTPLWMKERLRRCAIRAIHPVVDILNYVMLELGQPMHAFDKNTLSGALCIRESKSNETLQVLGGQTVVLDRPTLVIADEQQALAIAGIIGGEHSAVTASSTDIILESAFFQPAALRGQARHYGLQTESSHRFERGVDPQLQSTALEYASYLISELLGGEVGPTIEVKDTAHLPVSPTITLHKHSPSSYLGVEIDDDFIARTLTRLGCELEAAAWHWQCTPPSYRFDLAIEEDLIEELARLYGYDRIPEAIGSHRDFFTSERADSVPRWRDYLSAQGYFEVITYSFISPKQLRAFTPDAAVEALRLENPVSLEMSAMRTSLWPGLLKVLKHNLNRQHDRVCIFEQGAKFLVNASKIEQRDVVSGLVCGTVRPNQWGDTPRLHDFYDLKGDLENLLQPLAPQLSFKRATLPGLHRGQCATIHRGAQRIGCIGALSPALVQAYKLPLPVFLFELDAAAMDDVAVPRYQTISAYPMVRRDLAFVVPKALAGGDILEYLDALQVEYLVERFIFDVFEDAQLGEDVKNIGIALVFQDAEQTLHKDSIETLLQRLIAQLSEHFAIKLRLSS